MKQDSWRELESKPIVHAEVGAYGKKQTASFLEHAETSWLLYSTLGTPAYVFCAQRNIDRVI